MMIGEGMIDHIDTDFAQAVEETPWIANRRDRVDALPCERCKRLASTITQRHYVATAQLHRVLAVGCDAAVAYTQIHALQSTHRFAQGTGWQ